MYCGTTGTTSTTAITITDIRTIISTSRETIVTSSTVLLVHWILFILQINTINLSVVDIVIAAESYITIFIAIFITVIY